NCTRRSVAGSAPFELMRLMNTIRRRTQLRRVPCLSKGMSVYRKFDEGPPSESFVYPAKRQKVAHGSALPKPKAPQDEDAQRRRRKGAPSNELLKPTFR